jgi:GNAT superfamily N-acetyltransferase
VEEASLLISESWQNVYRGVLHNHYLDELNGFEWVASLTEAVKSPAMEVLLMRIDGRLIGLAQIGVCPYPDYLGEGELILLYLAAGMEGQGYGSALFRQAEEELCQRGYERLILRAFSANKRALNFYHKMGCIDLAKGLSVSIGGRWYLYEILQKSLRIDMPQQ